MADRKTPYKIQLDTAHAINHRTAGWWPFQDGGGTKVKEITGQNENGSMISMDPPNDWSLSTMGHCLDFDASDDYVDVTEMQFLTADAWSVSIW